METKSKRTKSAKAKSVNFVGVWKTYRSSFMGTPVKQTNPSTWTILPGNRVKVGDKNLACKVLGANIKIPASSATTWIGELLPNGILKVSTDNGMMSYFCKRKK